MEQIIPFLNRSNLLHANKGHMGGYQLAKQLSGFRHSTNTIYHISIPANAQARKH
ncbi:MAG: Rrf2 family transcriptional regulator [Clostridium sp.]|nr:Rrf2 family transcriptional regulator [Clostridium sp.]